MKYIDIVFESHPRRVRSRVFIEVEDHRKAPKGRSKEDM